MFKSDNFCVKIFLYAHRPYKNILKIKNFEYNVAYARSIEMQLVGNL